MSRKRVPVLLLVCAGLAAVCRRTETRAPQSSAAAETPSVSTVGVDESRQLCLADPGADAAIDHELRAAGKRVRETTRGADDWVALGRLWMKKARYSSDPGFYLNLQGCVATALSVEPGSLPALELRSLALMNDHKFDPARLLAEQILQRQPEDVVALGTLSDALLELGHYDEATQAAQRQMNALPGMAAHVRGSYLCWLRGDTTHAKLFIKDALVD